MDSTSPSLLERLQDRADTQAWQRLLALYEPWLRGWLSRHALQPADVEDILQEIMVVVSAKLPDFVHNGQPGAFRNWLRTIMTNRVLNFLRSQRRHDARQDAAAVAALEELADPNSLASKQWDQEHDQHLVRRLLASLRNDFTESTWRVFHLLVIENQPAAAVAQQLGMSINSVYVAKARVLSRLRAELRGLMDV